MVFRRFLASLTVSLLASFLIQPLHAVQPGETLLPPDTVGFLAVPDVDDLRAKWNETQLGQLVNDPVMAPFVDDLKRQIRTKLSKTDARLGISWEDLDGVYGGEVCVAVVQPWDQNAADKRIAASVDKDVVAAQNSGKTAQQIAKIRASAEKAAREQQEKLRVSQRGLVLLVDVTGHRAEAEELLGKVNQELLGRGGKAGTATIAGVTLTKFTMPADEHGVQDTVFHVIHENQLIATDNERVANNVLERTTADHGLVSLAATEPFVTVISHVDEKFGDQQPQARWFLDPFGYAEVTRAYEGGRRRRGTDMLHVLQNQGFDAIQGLGGYIALSTESHQIRHQSYVFAPPVTSAEHGKYRLAANMLEFPNSHDLLPEAWIPGKLSTYLTFNWKMSQAFESVSTLVDEIADDEVFEDVLKSIETDPNGPQIDIRNDLIAHLADRATMVTDYRTPITPQSERLLFAIKVNSPDAVMATINKTMESDPNAKKREHDGQIIWEILNDEPIEVEAIQIDDAGFGFGFDEPEVIEDEKPLIPNSAVTVANGHLLIASHVDYIVEILAAAGKPLETAKDFQAVRKSLEQLGSSDDSVRFFTRSDEAYRPTYELIRQGKMPEAESILGSLLNRLWEPDEEGELRQQYIDGTKMPEFVAVQKYLGPGGVFIRSDETGWSVSGCLLERKP